MGQIDWTKVAEALVILMSASWGIYERTRKNKYEKLSSIMIEGIEKADSKRTKKQINKKSKEKGMENSLDKEIHKITKSHERYVGE